ncbi:MAG: NTP transferase domain-containing protein [Flavisolibacter sp.]
MVSAIVMAAGLSTRIGTDNKLLLPFRHKNVIETTLGNIIGSGIKEIIVVLGHEAEKVQNSISHLNVQITINPEYSSGLTSSIKSGVRISNGIGYLLCLADMVLIEPVEYRMICDGFKAQINNDSECICIPEFEGQRGNPVLLSASYKEQILQHEDPNGCKGIVQKQSSHIWPVKMKTDHILKDLDTLEDYNKIRIE